MKWRHSDSNRSRADDDEHDAYDDDDDDDVVAVVVVVDADDDIDAGGRACDNGCDDVEHIGDGDGHDSDDDACDDHNVDTP